TDVQDAEWICQLVEHGLVRPSFVPPKPIRELRDLTRYRKAQIDERGREAQRLDKVLQDAGIKLSSVATDILGKSGRDMLVALVSGTQDPQVLAELARGRLRTKIPLLRRALQGHFVSHHRLIVEKILAKLDFLDETIADLSAEIDRLIAPFAAEVDLLDTITGVDRRAAECIIAEIGVEMARFGSSARLASWAGRCPGHHESAGKHKSGRSRPGSKWLAATLAQCAEAAGRSKNTYLGAQFQTAARTTRASQSAQGRRTLDPGSRLPRARPPRSLPGSRRGLVPAPPPRGARPPPRSSDRSTRIPRHHRTYRARRLNQLNSAPTSPPFSDQEPGPLCWAAVEAGKWRRGRPGH
ncbi:MAG TPA: IS110 family transposase, partial [Mycobacterium sp.]|nr:IS110 family transposase [Mycobacterium sp.]